LERGGAPANPPCCKAVGLIGRIIIAITGVVVAMMSITGVYIWWKKRRGRRGSHQGDSAAMPQPDA